MQNKNTPFPLAGLLDAGAITGIVAALLYTAGWSYAYHYFSRFHLGLTELGITKDTLFIYSLWVLKGSLPAVISCFFTIGLYFLLRLLWRKKAIIEEIEPSEKVGEEGPGGPSSDLALGTDLGGVASVPLTALHVFLSSWQLGWLE
ncbi:MAG: hypothetical protein D3909_00480 [Candidatus Electrothrix sp. ATG1]|nr:hypothetical protein [Candidatus Electrothrix sp. ATG1]